jgi:hypothetical protein
MVMSDAPQEVQTEARKLGWRPLEQFKGDPEKWVDAEEFVERGKTVLPLVKAANGRLTQELSTANEKIGTMAEQLAALQGTVKALQSNYSKQTEKAVEVALTNLKASLREAREAGDVDKEIEILDAIQDTQEARKQAKKDATNDGDDGEGKPPAKKDASPYSQELKDWEAAHQDLMKDKKRLKAFTRLVEDVRDDQETDLTGPEFLDYVLEKLEAQEQGTEEDGDLEPVQRTPNKVATGKAGTTQNSKGYASLPSDAKRMCEAEAERFVGEGKLYKTKKDWQDAFARDYYEA